MQQYPLEPKKLRDQNFKKYKGISPSFDLVIKTIEKSKLKRKTKFALVWGMPKDSIRLYLNGHRNLPATYWHIFYDFDKVNKKYIRKVSKLKKRSDQRSNNIIPIPNKHHIDEFKIRQSTG